MDPWLTVSPSLNYSRDTTSLSDCYMCQMFRCSQTTHHIRLPSFHVDTAIDTPPEVIFRFSLPGKDRESWQREGESSVMQRSAGTSAPYTAKGRNGQGLCGASYHRQSTRTESQTICTALGEALFELWRCVYDRLTIGNAAISLSRS